jgi:hypothetical protein
MSGFVKFGIALLLAACAGLAAAQVPPSPFAPNSSLRAIPPAELKFPLAPFPQAVWFSGEAPGSGWYFAELDPTPELKLLNVAGYSYTPDGEPLWFIATGPRPAVSATPAQIWADQPLAEWSVDLIESRGGNCINCPYRANTTFPSPYGRLDLTWVAPSRIRARVNGVALPDLEPADVALGPLMAQRLAGELWVERRRKQVSSAAVNESRCRYVHDPVPSPATEGLWEIESGAVAFVRPQPDAIWFQLRSTCVLAPGLPSSSAPLGISAEFIYVNPGDVYGHQVALGTAQPIDGTSFRARGFRISPNTQIGRYYVTGPDEIVGLYRQAHDTSIIEIEERITRQRPSS